jgi:hypothetical protein
VSKWFGLDVAVLVLLYSVRSVVKLINQFNWSLANSTLFPNEFQWSSAAQNDHCLDLINQILIIRGDSRIFYVPVRPVQADNCDSLQLDRFNPVGSKLN